MTAFNGHAKPVHEVLDEALRDLGDLSKAKMVLVDDFGDFNPGNEKSAQLLEVFNTPARGNAPQEIMIVTRYMGQDSRETETPQKLKQRFGEVVEAGFNAKMFPLIAERMVEETVLPKNMREGLWAIVKRGMEEGKFRPADGIGNLRNFVNEYIQHPMTPEWEKKLVDNSPVTQVVAAMQQGAGDCGQAPQTARFTRRPGR
jgi:hypothetical protein